MPFILVSALGLAAMGCGMASDGETKAHNDAGIAADRGAYSLLTLVLKSGYDPAPGDLVEVQAVMTGVPYQVKGYFWTVADPKAASVTFTTKDAAGSTIRFVVGLEGRYALSCRVTLEGTSLTYTQAVSIDVESKGTQKLEYTMRVMPPPSSGLPPSEQTITVGAVDQTLGDWSLKGGSKVAISVDDGKAALPVMLRLLRKSGDPLPRDVLLSSGQGTVQLDGAFHALFIPTTGSASTPPALAKPNMEAGKLGGTWKVTLDAGLSVTGTVLDSAGSAVAGAAVSLHTTQDGLEVPSTLATTTSAGQFSLRGRKGTAALLVLPPEATGLPPVMAQSSSLLLDKDASGWTLRYQTPTLVSIRPRVHRSDGSTPASGSMVRISLLDTLAAATLQTSEASVPAQALVQITDYTDAAGQLVGAGQGTGVLTLPVGKYQVEVWPSSTMSQTEGYQKLQVQLAAAGPGQVTLLQWALLSRAQVTGKVVDNLGQPIRAGVTASGASGVFQVLTDSAGSFSLLLDNLSQYDLVVRAVGGEARAGSLIKPKVAVNGQTNLASLALPQAVMVSGRVVVSGGLALAGSQLRIWCSDARCSSQDILDQTNTLSDGTFQLRLPFQPVK